MARLFVEGGEVKNFGDKTRERTEKQGFLGVCPHRIQPCSLCALPPYLYKCGGMRYHINRPKVASRGKFPEGYVAELAQEEVTDLRSKFLIANGHSVYSVYSVVERLAGTVPDGLFAFAFGSFGV